MTEPQATTPEGPEAHPSPAAEPASAEREDTADLSLRDIMARAMAAQGKVDPAEVFEEAEHVDLDDSLYWEHEMREDPGPDLAPLDEEQEALALDDEKRSTYWEP